MSTPQVNHTFAQIPHADIPRSSFNRSFNRKTTGVNNALMPIYVDEMLPGDTFRMNMAAFGRLSTPIVPIMDNLYVDCFFFAVPNRLLWTNWAKFNGAQTNPGDSTSFLIPTTSANHATADTQTGSLWDFMGLPISDGGIMTADIAVSALPFRAYNLIWNEWFRDENLQNSVTVNVGDGPDTYSGTYAMWKRGKRHDYFTSSLPWPQKGTAVSIPLGTSALVKRDSSIAATWVAYPGAGATPAVNNPIIIGGGAGSVNNSVTGLTFDPVGGSLYADLSTATAATINSLRQSFQIQKIYERDARGGTRYTEIVRAHFGVTSPDARLQRPEFLGGGSFPIIFSSVPQASGTGATGTTTPQGNLAAFATVATTGRAAFTYSATEHMTMIGLAALRADYTYQQKVDRMWSRSTRFDFYWPALSHIGEQSILNKEIYCDGSGNDTATFGYQERYAEYRYKPNELCGFFRSKATTTLDYWHVAQNFTSLPALNATFINENPPISRVSASASSPPLLLDFVFNLICARPMPVYSVPGMTDHF